ncbi:MAG: long-chain-fatty-acid--CoA ligase [Proteobacteria bacterium]|nr:long-chain-fatty-acid--CoA ligase [Pseudomonadota bacterium]
MLLHDHIAFWARISPRVEFAREPGRSVSYAEAAAEVERIAGAFAAVGVGPGERVAVLAKNCADYPLLCFGIARAGAVSVPLNYRLAPREWEYILADSGARVLFAQPALAEAVDGVLGGLSGLESAVALGSAPPGWTGFDRWVRGASPPPPAAVAPPDDAVQMYTSGTTGLPKGAVLSHDAVFHLVHHWSVVYPLLAGERQIAVSPMYHASGFFGFCHAAAVGASLRVMADFDAVEAVRILDEERIVRASFVPAVIQAMLSEVPGVERREFADLRAVSYGGSPIAESTLRRALRVFGCDFIQSYGMTELPCSTYLGPAEHREALEGRPELLLSVGRAAPGSELKIVGEDGRELGPGQIGEICSRGPQVMSGYWNRPEDTRSALRDGWMHTGDAGSLDEDGYLYVKDRTKDMIVSGGENIYPREVENVLFDHPAVADAAVIGVPSERWGETVKAVVVLAPGAGASEDDLIEFCRGRIAGYKRPRSVDFVAELPRNASGKVLKRELREPYWTGRDRRVG